MEMKVLGIETSCDETAAGIVEDGKKLLSNIVFSSMDLHKAYGGIVPEIAARSHIESIIPVVTNALEQAACRWQDIDAIAVTNGAGLGGSLLVGVTTARTLAIARQKPLYGINHVEAHIYANFITEISSRFKAQGSKLKLPSNQPEFPMLGIIVSGGHSQLVLWRDHFDYQLLGRTHDDAIGEAFDKVARIIGLPYPGGPSIEKTAKSGDPHAFKFPKAKLDNKYDFSFSGLKTAVLRTAQAEIGKDFSYPSHQIAEQLSDNQVRDIAASFQHVAIETVVDKVKIACQEFKPKSLVIGGGVAASQELRRQLNAKLPIKTGFTDQQLCTDNGAMVAALGCYKITRNQPAANPYELDIRPQLAM